MRFSYLAGIGICFDALLTLDTEQLDCLDNVLIDRHCQPVLNTGDTQLAGEGGKDLANLILARYGTTAEH